MLGNGTWLNIGGNQGVTYGGEAAARQDGGGPYNDPDGRQSYVAFVSDRLDKLTHWSFLSAFGKLKLVVGTPSR